MSATKSKPAGRAVRKEPKVRVRKYEDFLFEDINRTVNDLPTEKGVLTVHGYTGSAKKLKRLVEIAGMDDLPKHLAQKLWETSSLRHGLFMPTQFQGICEHVIREALGLSTAQGRKGKLP